MLSYSGKFSNSLFSKILKIANHFRKYFFQIFIATQLLSLESRRIYENIISKSHSRRFFENLTFRKFPAIRYIIFVCLFTPCIKRLLRNVFTVLSKVSTYVLIHWSLLSLCFPLMFAVALLVRKFKANPLTVFQFKYFSLFHCIHELIRQTITDIMALHGQ